MFMNKNSWEKLNDEQKAFLNEKVEWVESLNKEDLELAKKEKELQAARFTQQEQINKELRQDSTPTNQLKIMTRVMKDFANETN